MTPAGGVCFRVLYLFAGRARQADFGKALDEVVALWNSCANAVSMTVALEEIDTLRGGLAHNLLEVEAQDSFIRRVSEGEFDLVIVTPPCNTFSRAVFQKDKGPKPIRDKQWPKGFPWLEKEARDRAEESNSLVDFSISILQAASVAKRPSSWRCTRSWLEFPEDLGRAPLGVPASIWQRSELRALPGMERRSFFQCEVAAVDYSKATGVMTDIAGFFEGFPSYPGWPEHDEECRYLGPLPPVCRHGGHPGLRGKDEDGNWKTGPTGAYPAEICRHMAVKAFADFKARANVQVSASAPADGDEGRAGPLVLDIAGPLDFLADWLGGSPELPASKRDYVSGSSVTLGLKFGKSRVIIDPGYDLPKELVPSINTIITETLKKD